MSLNSGLFTKILFSLLILAALVGLGLKFVGTPTISLTKQCNIDSTLECIVLVNDQQISVQFLQKIQVEEELFMTINIPSNAKITNMWVQGVNMYMGKNAVITDSVHLEGGKKVHNARLFLGSCSEPAMKWQLVIQTESNSKGEQSWFFNFSTDRRGQ